MNEREVRTRAGWIGVEISRSRVRTPGKAGYGLYRVRGERPKLPTDIGKVSFLGSGEDPFVDVRTYVPTEWTAYAFTLEEIGRAVQSSINRGTPTGPGVLAIWSSATGNGLGESKGVPTRWTQAYRGRRDLGAPVGEGLERGQTGRQRQRQQNAEFQAAHLERRAHGLVKRHAAKLERGRNASG